MTLEFIGYVLSSTFALRFLEWMIRRGGWIQDDKAKLWSKIGELEAYRVSLQERLDKTEAELFDTKTQLILAQQEQSNLSDGYERLKRENAELREENQQLRRELGALSAAMTRKEPECKNT